MKKFFIGLLLSVFLTHQGICEVTDDSIQLIISSDKEVYELGEKVKISFEFKNVSDALVELSDEYVSVPADNFYVSNEYGNKFERDVERGAGNFVKTLSPGEQMKVAFTFLDMGGDELDFIFIEGENKQKYELIGNHSVYAKRGVIVSNKITFEIVDKDKESKTYIVESVIEGDIIKLRNGEIIRLGGIDAPESTVNEKAKRDSERTGQSLENIIKAGQEATEFVKSLGLEGKEVRLEYDVRKRDGFGRLLAYVYYDHCKGIKCESPPYYVFPFFHKKFAFPINCTGYLFVNGTIVKAGYAKPMSNPPNVKYDDLFKYLYVDARKKGRGLYKYNYESLYSLCEIRGDGKECCMESVKIMEEGNYKLASDYGDAGDEGCASGSRKRSLKCSGSFKWCVPIKK